MDINEEKSVRDAGPCGSVGTASYAPAEALEIAELIRRNNELKKAEPKRGASVLIPLVWKDGEPHLLFEVRAYDLKVQPGEVCFPGGRIEEGETPQDAVLREVSEELFVRKEQVRILGLLEEIVGSRGYPVYVFVGVIDGYDGSFSADEVAEVQLRPLSWFLTHEPERYPARTYTELDPGFPFERIPGGKSYPWGFRKYDIPFYMETSPVLWGMTARITASFCSLLKKKEELL